MSFFLFNSTVPLGAAGGGDQAKSFSFLQKFYM
jgi:hypothetical protein